MKKAVCALTPDQADRRGIAWVIGSFVLCPCHLPITLAVIAGVLSGTALAHQVNVDEGGLMLYLVVGQKGRHVTIEAHSVAASYAGDLNAAGTEIAGTWTQGTLSLPLTLTRATVEGQR